jgi:hypothetical protein
MDEATYIEQRINDQINWLDKKSGFNQKWYKRLRKITLLCSILIPFASGILPGEAFYTKVIVGLLGISIAFCEGLSSINKYQENWLEYRTTAETLKRELILYQTRSGSYDALNTEESFKLLVNNTEGVLSNEHKQWKTNFSKNQSEK